MQLDPAHYKSVDQLEAHFPHGAPSLADCERLELHGEVHFGRDVVVRARVLSIH